MDEGKYTAPEAIFKFDSFLQDCISSKDFYREAHLVLLYHTCRCAGVPRVKLNEETREFRRVAPGRAMNPALNEPTRRLLEAVAEPQSSRTRTKGKGKHVENQHR